MHGSRTLEITYASGKKYKTARTNKYGNGVVSERNIDGCLSEYYEDYEGNFLDKNFPTFSVKKFPDGNCDMKYYYPSNQVYKLVEGKNSNRGKDLSIYDLCPDVFWVGVGLYKKSSAYDLIFSINNDDELLKLSEYYNLDYPLPKGINLSSDDWNSKGMINFCKNILNETGVEPNLSYSDAKKFKYGSIKFKNNKPHLLKMYKSNYKG